MIHAIFFLSGVSALLFQHIWFREAGLVFGNSVWAASLVLSSFMAGLAIGNALSAAAPVRGSALRWYAALEIVVAVTGVGLVLGLPALGHEFVPSMVARIDDGLVQGVIRFVLGFVLLVIPTAAMGMTLPILVGRNSSDALYGAALGRLYGWNTLGAVVGALAGEAFLYASFGIKGTGFVAGGFNVAAALLTLGLQRTGERTEPVGAPPARSPLGRAEFRLLFIAAIAGACLLILEVVWTRFLQLFFLGTALTFAIMLATVLAGIAIGSLVAARIPGRTADPATAPLLMMLSALAVTACYAEFIDVLGIDVSGLPGVPWTGVAISSAALILPTAMLSGALFTALGTLLASRQSPIRATGLLTFANTLGAMIGALLAGFVLLPLLGMERTFRGIAIAYTIAALMTPGFLGLIRKSKPLLLASLLSVTFTVLFPAGLMERVYVRRALTTYVDRNAQTEIAAFREGLTETITYLNSMVDGDVKSTRLVTNGFSMSATSFAARRYMETFVYLPVAIHPGMRRALLISYGVGSTARALVRTSELERIDVVDISRDILDMAHYAVLPGQTAPLSDPRVVTHVEDGRFFLQSRREGYDLITSEPPPPHLGGVVNLYTREYFQLLRSRLNPQGIVSYWLPVHSLSNRDARAITSAFCAAFSDCTLWKGMDFDWILLGTNELKTPVSEERFRAQWSEAHCDEVRSIGLEVPEQLGALFMGDPSSDPALVESLPLEDNYPGRLDRGDPARLDFGPWRQDLMNAGRGRERFLQSAFIKAVWPAAMRDATLNYFDVQSHYDRQVSALSQRPVEYRSADAAVSLLRHTSLSVLPAILLGTPGDTQRLVARADAAGRVKEWMLEDLAILDLASRRYDRAVTRLRDVVARGAGGPSAHATLVIAMCLDEKKTEAGVERGKLPPDLAPDLVAGVKRACDTNQPN